MFQFKSSGRLWALPPAARHVCKSNVFSKIFTNRFPLVTSIQSIPPELEILRLGVHPNWRKQGLAEFLLTHLEIYAKTEKIAAIWLEVHEDNKSAISLYRKLNYKEIGSRNNYFCNPPGDALLLKKLLKHDA